MIDRIQAALLALIVYLDRFHCDTRLREADLGRYRVVYPEGHASGRMYWPTARDYSHMFGGEVEHLQTGRRISTRTSRIQEVAHG